MNFCRQLQLPTQVRLYHIVARESRRYLANKHSSLQTERVLSAYVPASSITAAIRHFIKATAGLLPEKIT